MTTDQTNALAEREAGGVTVADPGMRSEALPSVQIMFDDAMFARAEQIATKMSKARGVVPAHLIGAPEACFAVVCEALDSRLSPFFVAQNTAPIKAGEQVVGIVYQAKFVRAKLEQSGAFHWIEYQYVGDWTKVQNKWKWEKTRNDKWYQTPTYTEDDQRGLGVTVRGHLKGREHPDEITVDMLQMWPRNSTLWATDPKTQATYAAIRRFGNLYAPHVMGGARSEDDVDAPAYGPAQARDVSPAAVDLDEHAHDDGGARETVEVFDHNGLEHTLVPVDGVEDFVRELLRNCEGPDEVENLIYANRENPAFGERIAKRCRAWAKKKWKIGDATTSAEPAEPAEPTGKAEPAEPAEPTGKAEPAGPAEPAALAQRIRDAEGKQAVAMILAEDASKAVLASEPKGSAWTQLEAAIATHYGHDDARDVLEQYVEHAKQGGLL